MQILVDYNLLELLDKKVKESLIEFFVKNELIKKSYSSIPGISQLKALPSEYQFDFRIMKIKIFGWEKTGNIYKSESGSWKLPIKVFGKHNRIVLNKPFDFLRGNFGLNELRVSYNPDTGDPEINAIKTNFNLDHQLTR